METSSWRCLQITFQWSAFFSSYWNWLPIDFRRVLCYYLCHRWRTLHGVSIIFIYFKKYIFKKSFILKIVNNIRDSFVMYTIVYEIPRIPCKLLTLGIGQIPQWNVYFHVPIDDYIPCSKIGVNALF